MISVVMAYWNRVEVLTQNLNRYRELYPDLDLEIVIADDGSMREPAEVKGEYPWPVHVIRLPLKQDAKLETVPLNLAAMYARGEYILLTCPEVIHRAPVITGLVETARNLGPMAYVSAACWGGKFWYCHSTDMPRDEAVGRGASPKGSAFHFCALLRRDLFWAVKGFDDQYRDGAGFGDNDFLWSLDRVGTKFAIRDDLITDHVKVARSNWPKDGFARNKAIFERKWAGRF